MIILLRKIFYGFFFKESPPQKKYFSVAKSSYQHFEVFSKRDEYFDW